MDRNKMKRKIAMMLCVCVLFASSAPLALAEAEDTPSEPQVATLEENQPERPVSREKIGMKLTPNNGVVSVALTGTAGEGVDRKPRFVDDLFEAFPVFEVAFAGGFLCHAHGVVSILRSYSLRARPMIPENERGLLLHYFRWRFW